MVEIRCARSWRLRRRLQSTGASRVVLAALGAFSLPNSPRLGPAGRKRHRKRRLSRTRRRNTKLREGSSGPPAVGLRSSTTHPLSRMVRHMASTSAGFRTSRIDPVSGTTLTVAAYAPWSSTRAAPSKVRKLPWFACGGIMSFVAFMSARVPRIQIVWGAYRTHVCNSLKIRDLEFTFVESSVWSWGISWSAFLG